MVSTGGEVRSRRIRAWLTRRSAIKGWDCKKKPMIAKPRVSGISRDRDLIRIVLREEAIRETSLTL